VAKKKHHYLPGLHLRGFVDPRARPPSEPWLWVGDVDSGAITRRGPTNVAWESKLFAGSGGMQTSKSLEDFLAEDVEGPAAKALRDFAADTESSGGEIPGVVTYYLAWLAARSLALRDIYEGWMTDALLSPVDSFTEPPPPGFIVHDELRRPITMQREGHGARLAHTYAEAEALSQVGWRVRLEGEDFLEVVSAFAFLFQVRHFPRLSWFRFDAPQGGFFVTGDVPVVWTVDGRTHLPPSALKHPRVQLAAPLTTSVAVLACHPSASLPESIRVRAVNNMIGAAAQSFILGPGRGLVAQVVQERGASPVGLDK